MTLEQSQGHQTYNKNVDSEQGYNPAKCERSDFNKVWEKGNIKGFFLFLFFNQGNKLIISLEHMQK